MNNKYLYHFKKTRKQQAMLYIRMAAASLIYVLILLYIENYTTIDVPQDMSNILLIAFPTVAIILFLVALWHFKNPGTYEAIVTQEYFSVKYPGSKQSSFKLKISEIDKLEHRGSHGGGGRYVELGVVMKNGDFHHLSVNYGNNANNIYKALIKVNPEITFPKKANIKYTG